jgi:hypothetical protein
VESSIEGPSTVFVENNKALEIVTQAAFVTGLCGIATLVYVAIKRFRQGFRGEGMAREDEGPVKGEGRG